MLHQLLRVAHRVDGPEPEHDLSGRDWPPLRFGCSLPAAGSLAVAPPRVAEAVPRTDPSGTDPPAIVFVTA